MCLNLRIGKFYHHKTFFFFPFPITIPEATIPTRREKLNAIKRYDENQKTATNPEKPITVTHTKQLIPDEDYGAATALKHEVVQLLAQNDILKKRVEELESQVRFSTVSSVSNILDMWV